MESYKNKSGDILTVALCDSPNDLPILTKIDIPVIVQKTHGSYHSGINLPNPVSAGGVGPEGWNKAVLQLLSKLG